jgi:hypothetical protein
VNWFFVEPNVGRSLAMKGSRESAIEAFWNIDVCHLDEKCRSLSLIDDDGWRLRPRATTHGDSAT